MARGSGRYGDHRPHYRGHLLHLGEGASVKREIIEIENREQWLKLRQSDITASRIGALFDCHDFMTEDDLEQSISGGIDLRDSPAMRRGRILEPGVGIAIEEEHPDWRICKAKTYHRIPELRLGATPDFWVEIPGIGAGLIQAKTVSPEKFELWEGKPPLFYTLQTLVEMICADVHIGKLAVMVTTKSFPLYIYDVPRHREAESRIINAVCRWWQQWDIGRKPKPSPIDGLNELLDDGSTIDLSSAEYLGEKLAERANLIKQKFSIQKTIDEFDAHLKELMGNARFGKLPGWMISFSTVKRKPFSVAESEYRRLSIKRIKDDVA